MAASFFDSILSPIASMALTFGPTKTMPASSSARANAGVLREEAIAGMDRLGAGRLGSRDDLADVEIGLRGLSGADRHGLVGHVDMQRVAVGVGIDGHGLDPEPPRGPDDAAGDLAPIGDQKLGEHMRSPPRWLELSRGSLGVSKLEHDRRKGGTGYSAKTVPNL